MQTLIFLDLDNTILQNPFLPVIIPQVQAQIAAQTGHPAETILQAILEEHQQRFDDGRLSPVQVMDWDDIFQTLARRWGARLDYSAEEEVQRHAHPPHTEILEEAGSVLQHLRQAPHRRLMASTQGLSKYQEPVLAALGLRGYFDAVLTPDRTGFLKNQRGFFNAFPVEQSLTVCIGDTYRDDVHAPKRFGFLSIWIPRQHHPLEASAQALSPFERLHLITDSQKYPLKPDALLLSLGELLPTLEALEMAVAKHESR